MQLDVDDLREFYATPLGQMVRRLLTQRIRARWRGAASRDADRAGLRRAVPRRLSRRGAAARRADARQPGRAASGRTMEPRTAVLVDDDRLPLADESVDRLLAVHCLEVAEQHAPAAARDVARAGARGAHPARGSQPARRVGALRHDAVRARAPVQPPSARRAAGRRDVHAARLGQRAVLAAARPPDAVALGDGLGARRRVDCRRRFPACSSSRRARS